MNIIKKTALTFFMAISLGVFSTVVLAEEAVSSSTSSTAETITHIEKALEEVNKGDFSTARLHFKAARSASEKITGNEAIVKQANESLMKGQIQANQGNPKTSSDDLKKALELIKSIKN